MTDTPIDLDEIERLFEERAATRMEHQIVPFAERALPQLIAEVKRLQRENQLIKEDAEEWGPTLVELRETEAHAKGRREGLEEVVEYLERRAATTGANSHHIYNIRALADKEPE